MTEARDLSFPQEIEANRLAEQVPGDVTRLKTGASSLSVRPRGCFVTACELPDPFTHRRVKVLYSEPDMGVAKLTASHIMSPVGPNEGIGGQHGFLRWADYNEFPQLDGSRVAFQAKRSDNGLAVAKSFELTGTALSGHTTIYNSRLRSERTSVGEHYYFTLVDEQAQGLTVDGSSLDELLGEGAEHTVMSGKALFWEEFSGTAQINFPAGHTVRLEAEIADTRQKASLGMLIWHRPGTESICFEPTVGFDRTGSNDGLVIGAHRGVTLSTKIELVRPLAPFSLLTKEWYDKLSGQAKSSQPIELQVSALTGNRYRPAVIRMMVNALSSGQHEFLPKDSSLIQPQERGVTFRNPIILTEHLPRSREHPLLFHRALKDLIENAAKGPAENPPLFDFSELTHLHRNDNPR